MTIGWYPGHMNKARKDIANALQQVDVLRLNVDMVKKVLMHVMAVRVAVGATEPQVFVQVEAPHASKRKRLVSMQANQLCVQRLHRAARGKAQHAFGFAHDLLLHLGAGQSRGLRRIDTKKDLHP